ncbi:MAG: 7-carboxy-7-deazaguanine synthase QueE [Candidatus Omnitrophota bacterium]
MKAKISEIFKSVQGEGIYQGQPQVFVRFYGCNLSCAFCDTKFYRYDELTLDEALNQVFSHGWCECVSLTGGEPLLQVEFLKELIPLLKKNGACVYLETNGTLYGNLEKIIESVDIIAMDFKLESSTLERNFSDEHKKFLETALKKEVFVKAVIGRKTNADDIARALKIVNSLSKETWFIFQPENPFEELLTKKIIFLENSLKSIHKNIVTIPQMHKKLGIR